MSGAPTIGQELRLREMRQRALQAAAAWDESKHPRDRAGRFGEGGEVGSRSTAGRRARNRNRGREDTFPFGPDPGRTPGRPSGGKGAPDVPYRPPGGRKKGPDPYREAERRKARREAEREDWSNRMHAERKRGERIDRRLKDMDDPMDRALSDPSWRGPADKDERADLVEQLGMYVEDFERHGKGGLSPKDQQLRKAARRAIRRMSGRSPQAPYERRKY